MIATKMRALSCSFFANGPFNTFISTALIFARYFTCSAEGRAVYVYFSPKLTAPVPPNLALVYLKVPVNRLPAANTMTAFFDCNTAYLLPSVVICVHKDGVWSLLPLPQNVEDSLPFCVKHGRFVFSIFPSGITSPLPVLNCPLYSVPSTVNLKSYVLFAKTVVRCWG